MNSSRQRSRAHGAVTASLSFREELLYTIARPARPQSHMQSFAQLLLLEHADRLDDGARLLDRISETGSPQRRIDSRLLEYGRLSHEAVSLAPWISADVQRAAPWGEIQQRHAMFTSTRSGRMCGE